jgi:hypothetical protein
MRLIFAYEATKGKPVTDSNKNQKVAAAILDGSDLVVLVIDFLEGSYFIERVVDRFDADLYRSANFTTINDEAFVKYHQFLNVNGVIPKLG